MKLEIFPEYEEGLKDIEQATHLIILYWFDRAGRDTLLANPPKSKDTRGVFACRSPFRPNPIAFGVVEFLKREKNILWVRGLDALDETPILDIKPYSSQVDSISNARIGWLDDSEDQHDRRKEE